jgi:hypothetical protein
MCCHGGPPPGRSRWRARSARTWCHGSRCSDTSVDRDRRDGAVRFQDGVIKLSEIGRLPDYSDEKYSRLSSTSCMQNLFTPPPLPPKTRARIDLLSRKRGVKSGALSGSTVLTALRSVMRVVKIVVKIVTSVTQIPQTSLTVLGGVPPVARRYRWSMQRSTGLWRRSSPGLWYQVLLANR